MLGGRHEIKIDSLVVIGKPPTTLRVENRSEEIEVQQLLDACKRENIETVTVTRTPGESSRSLLEEQEEKGEAKPVEQTTFEVGSVKDIIYPKFTPSGTIFESIPL